MEVSAMVSVCQGLNFVVRGLLELNIFVDSLFGHVYCSVVVYMCMSIYDSATDAIALNEKSPQMRALMMVTTLLWIRLSMASMSGFNCSARLSL